VGKNRQQKDLFKTLHNLTSQMITPGSVAAASKQAFHECRSICREKEKKKHPAGLNSA